MYYQLVIVLAKVLVGWPQREYGFGYIAMNGFKLLKSVYNIPLSFKGGVQAQKFWKDELSYELGPWPGHVSTT